MRKLSLEGWRFLRRSCEWQEQAAMYAREAEYHLGTALDYSNEHAAAVARHYQERAAYAHSRQWLALCQLLAEGWTP